MDFINERPLFLSCSGLATAGLGRDDLRELSSVKKIRESPSLGPETKFGNAKKVPQQESEPQKSLDAQFQLCVQSWTTLILALELAQ